MDKVSLHQHDRGIERLKLSPETVDNIQRSVDAMWFSGGHKKLLDDHYHINIRDPYQNLLGYAALKRISSSGKRPRLILASILSKHMKPRGSDISSFVKADLKDNTAKLDLPPSFSGFKDVPNNIDKS
jgi:hypothetical protein